MENYIIDIIVGLVSMAAFVISLFTFRRDRSKDVENELYRIKLESLSELVYEIDRFFHLIAEIEKEFNLIKESNSLYEEHPINKYVERIENQLFILNSKIIKNHIFFSQETANHFRKFADNLLQEPKSKKISIDEAITLLLDYRNKQLLSANEAVNLAAKELKIDGLNKILDQRLKFVKYKD